MNIQATFIDPEEVSAWQAASHFQLGSPSGLSECGVAAVGIRAGSEARWRVDVFAAAGQSCFRDVRCVGELVYIGYGRQVAVFSTTSETLASHSLDGYFGHLFAASDLSSPDLGSSVLVASASELLRFDDGQLLWRKSELGVDGVIIQRVQDGRIFGAGEWDPPGGWKPFQLDLASGDACRG